MSLHRLEVFICVAKHRHITRAAKELHISQPSVSRHLKLLEDDFGVVLHRKLSHGVELTPEGEEFLKGAQSVLLQYHHLKETFTKSHPRREKQYLKIGSSFAPSVSLLPPLLARFGRSNGSVGIVTISGISEALEQQVLKGEIEIAIITSMGNLDPLVYEPCGRGEVVAFVAANHPLAENKTLTVNDLEKVPLIVRTQTGDRPTRTWQQLRALTNGGTLLDIALDCDSHRTLRHAVKNGKGVGFSYRSYLARDIKNRKIKALKVEGFENNYVIYVIYAKEKLLSEAAENFLALIRRRNGNRPPAAQSIQKPA